VRTQVTARTLLNVTGRAGTHILDNLHQGSGAGDHYTDRDLEIGTELLVFNRPVLLCDCDEFTKQYVPIRPPPRCLCAACMPC